MTVYTCGWIPTHVWLHAVQVCERNWCKHNQFWLLISTSSSICIYDGYHYIYNDYYFAKNLFLVRHILNEPSQSRTGSNQFLYHERFPVLWGKRPRQSRPNTPLDKKNSSEKYCFRVIEHKINRRKPLDKKFNVCPRPGIACERLSVQC